MRVAVIGADAKTLVNFRGELLRAMVEAGHDVTAIALDSSDDVAAALTEIGVRFESVRSSRAGRNPAEDLALLVRLTRLLRRISADLTLCYNPKPVVYGLLASVWAKVPARYALITGAGTVLTSGARGTNLPAYVALRALYMRALRHADCIFFQNPDDESMFRSRGILAPTQRARIVAGSGVNLNRFTPQPLPLGTTSFIFIARLIRTKGLPEFVEAARRIRSIRKDVQFQVLGPLDPNPASASRNELDKWIAEGAIEYLGVATDVRPFIANSHAVVLPSYYGEGIPRVLLEAMAMGRAIVTTNAPGCRETVVNGDNGLCIPARDVDALVAALVRLADDRQLLSKMGTLSRVRAAERFNVDDVNAKLLHEMGLLPAGVKQHDKSLPLTA
jgi:glycosyltransferase involved in cell wall biosynthesis